MTTMRPQLSSLGVLISDAKRSGPEHLTLSYIVGNALDYVNIFPEIMGSINNLKRRKERTDEDNIIMEINHQ